MSTAEAATPTGGQTEPTGKKGPLRRLYDWVLAWAERPGGPAALFGLATAESFFFPIPPDVLLIPLCLGAPKRAFRFAALCTAGSVLGGVVGYFIGATLFQAIGERILDIYGYHEQFDAVGRAYSDNLILALGTAGFTPIPYKVFTIAAGAFAVAFGPFVIISAVSRAARFFLVAGLIRVFGESIRSFIEKYFNLLTVALALAVIAGFLLVGLVFH